MFDHLRQTTEEGGGRGIKKNKSKMGEDHLVGELYPRDILQTQISTRCEPSCGENRSCSNIKDCVGQAVVLPESEREREREEKMKKKEREENKL